MTPMFAAPLFVIALGVTLAAAAVFAHRLDQVGVQLGMPEALLGLLTALAADGPEISSAIVALVKGDNDVSFGVVAGSNVFNLAAMIGVSAVLVGRVHLPRVALALEGTVAVLCTVVAAALVLGLLPAFAAALLFAAILLPYLSVLVRGPDALDGLPIAGRAARRLGIALAQREQPPARGSGAEAEVWRHALPILAAVALIIAGSFCMVESALSLAEGWNLPHVLVGVLLLAPLTSLPNAFTAVRLGFAARGSALVSEALNSNTINLVGGVVLPALLIDLGAVTASVRVDLAWLVAMTVGALALLGGRRGLGRAGGWALIALYLAFVVVQVFH